MSNIIEVKNLSKTYEYYKKAPGFMASFKALFRREKSYAHAVSEINFSIGEGELVGFLGPNGAGKTTTLKMLSGILYPTEGEARVLGHIPWKREPAYQKQFALVMGQKNQLWLDLPALESFILNKEIYGISDGEYKENLDELIELMDIKDILEVPVRKLSLGQRMKCELIAALLHKPRVLFLDEPTIGLDVMAQKNIRDFIKKYNREKKTTIIITSHYMEDIKELCERVIIIDHSKIIYDGKLAELINRYAGYKQLAITFNEQGVKREQVEPYGKIMEYSQYRIIFEVERSRAKDLASAILGSSLPVDDIFIDEIDISEVVRRIFNSNN
jgi:ABC-2 type transport system ATP-binding protein